MSKTKGLAILFIVIVLPLLIYVFLKGFTTQHFRALNSVSPSENGGIMLDSTSTHNVFDFYSINNAPLTQEGFLFHPDSLLGSIFIVNVYYSRDLGLYPRMIRSMRSLSKFFEKDDQIKLLSLTVDPENDSLAVIADIASRQDADISKWIFITGGKEESVRWASEGFLFRKYEGADGSEGFVQDEKFMLVDHHGRIRVGDDGFYKGTSKGDIERLKKDIRVLKHEMNVEER